MVNKDKLQSHTFSHSKSKGDEPVHDGYLNGYCSATHNVLEKLKSARDIVKTPLGYDFVSRAGGSMRYALVALQNADNQLRSPRMRQSGLLRLSLVSEMPEYRCMDSKRKCKDNLSYIRKIQRHLARAPNMCKGDLNVATDTSSGPPLIPANHIHSAEKTTQKPM